ncbi:MAG: oligopeptide:H+ symporter [Legionellales bacterium]|nr:oligopeptide:H+ symporter [Legionellales bacterium]
METVIEDIKISGQLSKPFWVLWAIELWERFGYYGVQAILALYFVNQLGYSESTSFYIFGSFSAFVNGFAWIGGWIGDKYFGAKRTMVLGAIILALSYSGLALSNYHTIFYALSGIIVGNALFKANPSSLISKLYKKGDPEFDGAMTLYYMAVNIGSMISMAITPIVASRYGWSIAFWICAAGLFLGLANYRVYNHALKYISTDAGRKPFSNFLFFKILCASILAILGISQLLVHTQICSWLIYTIVGVAFIIFIKIALSLRGVERSRMFVALILVFQGIAFFVLYNQMPTSLTFFALHNVNNLILGWNIPPAEYQVLNSIVIIVMSPILTWAYKKYPSTHVTKFCMGMTLCAIAFFVLAIPQYISVTGIVSPLWMLLTYFFQSTGELLISGLGLAMVAELCPENICGFVMGFWFLNCMLAGPIGAWVGDLTTVSNPNVAMSSVTSLHIYGNVFGEIGIATALIAILMWACRPALNKVLKQI